MNFISKKNLFCKLKKGDDVLCISGDSKKKTGKIIAIFKKKIEGSSNFNFYAMVEGMNPFKRKIRDQNGSFKTIESYRRIHVSNLIKKK